ncbi:hypothetical protein Mal35_43120 [Gimesia maris]|uniref:hypothetical protein n=1 Tax=Gimesia maris TaxID=122 RepID=UPI001187FE0A|nr:hypothetical protein [Gimesia maris]QDT80837.1 hypothetical protein Mal35_43120 [Gimesia maris]
MAWPDLSIEDFPPERDDEPSSLRQDIIDELSDHFACALNRELLKNPDEQIAKQRVIQNFGDPIKIARQLWLDAMKEKIMSQRIMTGISVLMAVCGVIVVGMVWSMMKESQAFNTRMMAQMTEIANRPQATVPGNSPAEDMNQISFQLVQGKEGGEPAAGFTGKLTKTGNKTDSFSLEAVSNAEGEMDFGKLPWGQYELFLKASWGEHFHSNVTVIPGRDYFETIVCPASTPIASPGDVPVQFEVHWPDKFDSKDWAIVCDFRVRESLGGATGVMNRIYGDHRWVAKSIEFQKQALVFVIDDQNKVSLCPLGQNGEFKDVEVDALKMKSTINLIAANGYTLAVIYLIPKEDLAKLSKIDINQKYSVLNPERNMLLTFDQLYRDQQGGGGMVFPSFTTLLVPFKKETSSTDSKDSVPEVAEGIQLSKWLSYSALKDQENVWQIKIPDLGKLEVPQGIQKGGVIGSGQGFF